MEKEISADNERFLLARARDGEEAAWEQLVTRYQEAVFRLAYLIVGDAADAEDVAQSVFIRAFTRLDQYDDGRFYASRPQGNQDGEGTRNPGPQIRDKRGEKVDDQN